MAPGKIYRTPPENITAQVAIIGSGPGGGTAAMILAEAGIDVVVLESGDYVTAEGMTQKEQEMMGKLFHEGGTRTTVDQGITILHGNVVGGSSVVNHLICFRTPDRLLELWAREGIDDLEPVAMKRRFDRIWEILNVAKIEPHQLNANNDRLRLGAQALGWEGDCFERNAHHCVGSGFCTIGCAYNAKQSAALTVVPLACKAGARVYANARIERIHYRDRKVLKLEGRSNGRSFWVHADTILMAGGAIMTPALLLHSKIPDPSSWIGRNLYLHPGSPVIGQFPGQHIDPTQGILQGYHVSQFSWSLHGHETDVLLEGVSGPPGVASVVVPGLGAEHAARMQQINEAAILGVLLRDHYPGRVTVRNDGRPEVDWTLHPKDALRLRDGIRRAAEAYFAAGASRCLSGHAVPVEMLPGNMSALDNASFEPGDIGMISYHQMGTCKMGGVKLNSATDPDGKLWHMDNLYVADASLFPTASGVNPQISVYGMSMRVAERLAAKLTRN